jgi:hypothetical protein
MSEEQPDEPMGSESEEQMVADSAESADMEMESLPDEEAMETQEESRFGRFLKRALRWVVVVLVVFTIGVVAMQIVRVGPLIDERNSLDQSLAEAHASQQDLQAELDRLEGVEAENEELARALQQTETRLAVLNILVDITRAQLALAQEDPAGVYPGRYHPCTAGASSGGPGRRSRCASGNWREAEFAA